MHKIGLRYEDKYVMERRIALVPEHVKQLVDNGVEIEVVRSAKRIFEDNEFVVAGASLVDEVTDSEIVIGVKEMPVGYFKKNKTYIFFSHTIKGQEYNMPLLKDMMEAEANLIDYEKIEDEQGKRLIFFGRFAGLAGMINSLWALGQRWKHLGVDTPFLKMKQTHQYNSLDEAKEVVKEVGKYIPENKDEIKKEIADIALYLFELADNLDIDLLDAMNQKLLENKKKYPQFTFYKLDIINDPLPKTDVILCRDCLVHLTIKQIKTALYNFKKSGARFLLTTTFTRNRKNNTTR